MHPLAASKPQISHEKACGFTVPVYIFLKYSVYAITAGMTDNTPKNSLIVSVAMVSVSILGCCHQRLDVRSELHIHDLLR